MRPMLLKVAGSNFYRFSQKFFLLQIMCNSGSFPFCSLTLNYAVFTRMSLKLKIMENKNGIQKNASN